jgi:hypothetical protein
VGEKLSFDSGKVVVTLEHKSGQRARLRIVAGPLVKIEFPSKAPVPTG